MKLANGWRVRVELDQTVLLADDLDEMHTHSSERRTLAAQLSPGEPVWVHGTYVSAVAPEETTAVDGYRGAPGQAMVLRSTAK